MRFFKQVIRNRTSGPVLQYFKLDGSGELLELLDIDGDGRPEYRSSDKNYMSLEAFDMNRLVGTWEMSGCTGVTTECSEMEFQTLKKLAERAASGRAG